MQYASLAILGYLCGSIPFGKLIARRYGIDIQQRGSGNIGFSNVQRVLGWRPGLLTLAADILKGLLPTALAWWLTNKQIAFWTGICAILGHVFSVWLRFRGGKGIATGLGVVIILQPLAAVTGAILYVIFRCLIHNSGRSSMLGTIGLVAVGCLLSPHDWKQYALLLLIALWTLRRNIAGTVPHYDA